MSTEMEDGIRRMKQEELDYQGLKGRGICVLINAKLNKQQAKLSIESGTLKPGSFRNYGWKTHEAVCNWVGITPPPKKPKKTFICKHCGKDVS
jgi:hypothetical protein